MSDLVKLRNGGASITPDDVEAFDTNKTVFNKELSKHEIVKYYNEWAENGNYDKHLEPTRYTGPEVTASHIDAFFPTCGRSKLRILDVAAGTGRVGLELHRYGFQLIDGLDPSEGMLAKARNRGVYSNLFKEYIGGDNTVPVSDCTYDAITCSGGFGDGHIPASALHEMIRIVRPGGLICICMREEYLYSSVEYQNTLQPLMDLLEREDKWKLLARETVDKYFLSKSGIVFMYAVL